MVGPMIDEIIENINIQEINMTKGEQSWKICMYAGHDFNVASFTRAHGFWNPEGEKIPVVPDYGSAIIVEKLKDENGIIWIDVSKKYEN